jgi:hypothetical protein
MPRRTSRVLRLLRAHQNRRSSFSRRLCPRPRSLWPPRWILRAWTCLSPAHRRVERAHLNLSAHRQIRSSGSRQIRASVAALNAADPDAGWLRRCPSCADLFGANRMKLIDLPPVGVLRNVCSTPTLGPTVQVRGVHCVIPRTFVAKWDLAAHHVYFRRAVQGDGFLVVTDLQSGRIIDERGAEGEHRQLPLEEDAACLDTKVPAISAPDGVVLAFGPGDQRDCVAVRVVGCLRGSGRRTPHAGEQHDGREERLHEPIMGAPVTWHHHRCRTETRLVFSEASESRQTCALNAADPDVGERRSRLRGLADLVAVTCDCTPRHR